mgnify:CR=1 FL=1
MTALQQEVKQPHGDDAISLMPDASGVFDDDNFSEVIIYLAKRTRLLGSLVRIANSQSRLDISSEEHTSELQ